MRILLTGTSGQVGSALWPLLRRSQEVLAPNRAEFDLSNPNALAAALDRLEVDLIINPAAYTAVDRAEDEPELAFRINAEAPAELARWAARHNVPLVHFSTDYVFDGSGETPWREEEPVSPALELRPQQVGRRKSDPGFWCAAADHSHVLGLCGTGHQFPSYHGSLGARA